jgi:signal transduction histidine kinase
MADEQAALRRLAELVAPGSEEEVYDAVTTEATRVVGAPTMLVRFDTAGTYSVVAAGRGAATVGDRDHLPPDGEDVVAEILHTWRAAQVPPSSEPSERGSDEDERLGSGVGVPIVVDDRLWGALYASTPEGRQPTSAENALQQLGALVAAAVANVETRGHLEDLAAEQAALRRIAELVAGGAPPQMVLDAVAAEASALLRQQPVTLVRFEGDDELVVVAVVDGPVQRGTKLLFEPDTLPDRVRRGATVDRVDDYTHEHDAALAADHGLVAAVAAPISVAGRVWGMLTATSTTGPLPPGTEDRLDQFARLVSAALANGQSQAEMHALVEEQAALRRVAELAAQDAPADKVLQAVAVEASGLAGVEFGMVLRYVDRDGGNQIVALDGAPDNFALGMRAPGTGDGSVHRVWRSGRAARVERLGLMSGLWPQLAHERGFTTSAGVPITIRGALWGALIVAGRGESFPRAIEQQLASFAELAATAIAATDARQELRMVADEQAALRRVAELVARGATPGEVFTAAARETSALLGSDGATLVRYEGDGGYASGVAVAVSNGPVAPGVRVPLDTDSAPGGGVAAAPVIVEGRVWGALTTNPSGLPLPADSHVRLTAFADLVAVAIAQAENRSRLTASRARVIVTADETRRRLQRDVHDGAQQRLVHTIVALKLAREAVRAGREPDDLLHEALVHAELANKELRDIVHGILPASLTRGGLRAGLESLVSDLPLAVDLRVRVPRLPPPLETTGYFVVAEAMTNVVKHSRATRASIDIDIHADGETVVLEVRDNGVGGADPAAGSGLTGLMDRVEASTGTITVTSVPGTGTTVRALLPLAPPPTLDTLPD